MSVLARYTHWLHTQWPAGVVEKLPAIGKDGLSSRLGIYITGDLTGIPLLKFALQSGVRAVRAIDGDPSFQSQRKMGGEGAVDVAIIGAGVSGYAAAAEARKRGLSFVVIEASRPLSTLVNFPRAKPIYVYPAGMTPDGDLQVQADTKEALVEELEEQIARLGIETQLGRVERIEGRAGRFEVRVTDQPAIQARRVIIAIGRGGDYRKLEVPGEELDKVYNRLHDPKDFAGKDCLVVGGGDSALETAAALAQAGARVSVSYRQPEFSRPKSENIGAVTALSQKGLIHLHMASHVKEIRPDSVTLADRTGGESSLPNDVVFSMTGREPPLDFLRRSGIRLDGEWSARNLAAPVGFFLFCVFMYLWKAGGNPVANAFIRLGWFPFNFRESLAGIMAHPESIAGTVACSMTTPAFYYGLVYSMVVTLFGIQRMRRRQTPYVRAQTWTLIAIQVIPLFILPTLLLPWLGHNHLLPGWFEDTFFPKVDYDPHGREYWRAAGFILAWPLFIYNVFTDQPLWAWLAVSFLQTFVLIPWLIYYFGKGAYCGWICSCGALAETLGDTERSKMPHGPKWNRLNMAGQAILALTFFMLFIRILGWMGVPGMGGFFYRLKDPFYKFGVDVFLSGILGVGLYFLFSGRVWCRFICPLAALMHIYARFSRFRIFSEKKKCISCNVCTSVCHQGIDVMNFANKGIPMNDPECVRCSACVQTCPTGVLTFGQAGSQGGVLRRDRLTASPLHGPAGL